MDVVSSLCGLTLSYKHSILRKLDGVAPFIIQNSVLSLSLLEGAARYAGILLAPAEGFGRGLFLPKGQKRAFYTFVAQRPTFFCDQ